MVVKAHKDVHVVMGIVVVGTFGVFLISWVKYGMIATILMGGVVLCFLCQWFSIGKTLIMDTEGCNVKILCFSKKYLWKDLQVKRIERWDGLGSLPSEPLPLERRGVVFSRWPIGKSEKTRPEDYAFFRPFFMSYFFVYFSIGQPLIHRGAVVPEIYNVDEDEFMNKMYEWNVKLDVSMEQKSPYVSTDDHLFSPSVIKVQKEEHEAIKVFVQKENQKLRDSITGYRKCRVYKILEMLKYNHEIGVVVNCSETSMAIRCIHEKNRRGNVVKTFYIEDKKYERLEEIREILERHCNEEGFLSVGLVDSSLLDCRVRRMDDVF